MRRCWWVVSSTNVCDLLEISFSEDHISIYLSISFDQNKRSQSTEHLTELSNDEILEKVKLLERPKNKDFNKISESPIRKQRSVPDPFLPWPNTSGPPSTVACVLNESPDAFSSPSMYKYHWPSELRHVKHTWCHWSSRRLGD